VTFEIVPEEGWYLKRLIFDGKEIENINPDGETFVSPPVTGFSTLQASFSKIENTESIPVFSAPWTFFHNGDVFCFGKVFSGLEPDERGLLISEELENPEDGVGDTVRVKSKYSANGEGYFGFQLVNKTTDYNKVVHIRPYVVYNGILNAGITKKINFSGGDIDGLTVKDSWLSKNRLNYADVKKYSY